MERGISRVTDNELLIDQARNLVEQDFSVSKQSPEIKESPTRNFRQIVVTDCIDTPVYTFTLPDITRYPEDFREFLKKDLIGKVQFCLKMTIFYTRWRFMLTKHFPAVYILIQLFIFQFSCLHFNSAVCLHFT